ncbi:hypothetical protein CM9_01905 [Mycoplasmoides genitalium M2321]|nr:hypothetical protein CM9_01905 [Mycoplasmoides genitalium M2321]
MGETLNMLNGTELFFNKSAEEEVKNTPLFNCEDAQALRISAALTVSVEPSNKYLFFNFIVFFHK